MSDIIRSVKTVGGDRYEVGKTILHSAARGEHGQYRSKVCKIVIGQSGIIYIDVEVVDDRRETVYALMPASIDRIEYEVQPRNHNNRIH